MSIITTHITTELVSSTDAAGTATIPQSDALEYHLALVTISAAGSVVVEGSTNGSRWVPLSDAVTATDSIAVQALAPYMRVAWTGNTGTIIVDLVQHEEL